MTHFMDLIVDSFAGGGAASCGIEAALGRSPDIAINHDPLALAMHAANHPATYGTEQRGWFLTVWLGDWGHAGDGVFCSQGCGYRWAVHSAHRRGA